MIQRTLLSQSRHYAEASVTAVVLTIACFLHFYLIDQLPRGFYVDESSIGYNAYLISKTGTDEHGMHWPLFFEAFGEYKNPLYIYLLAGLYRIFGFSQWTTRALSACFWLVGSFYLLQLSRRLFENHTTRLYVAIAISFTPWLFSLSRISFELIALYPLLAIHLYGLHRGIEDDSRWWILCSGISMGLSVYAYTTCRLLAPLYCVAVLSCYSAKRFRTAQYLFSLGAAISSIPFIFYALSHIDNLSRRFNTITYLHDPSMSALAKIWTFLNNYLDYFSLSFLLTSGDPNLRHHTGFGGELMVSSVILLIVSIWAAKRRAKDRFYRYLIVGFMLSPVAAALTTDIDHSLRAFPMAVFGIMISAYGLHELTLPAARTVVAATALCSALYVLHYFIAYPTVSAEAFENYGLKEALISALHWSRGRVILSDEGQEPYMDLLFFGTLTRAHIPLLVGSRTDLRPGDAYIFYDTNYATGRLYRVEIMPAGPLDKRAAAKP